MTDYMIAFIKAKARYHHSEGKVLNGYEVGSEEYLVYEAEIKLIKGEHK